MYSRHVDCALFISFLEVFYMFQNYLVKCTVAFFSLGDKGVNISVVQNKSHCTKLYS